MGKYYIKWFIKIRVDKAIGKGTEATKIAKKVEAAKKEARDQMIG